MCGAKSEEGVERPQGRDGCQKLLLIEKKIIREGISIVPLEGTSLVGYSSRRGGFSGGRGFNRSTKGRSRGDSK